MVVMCSQIHDCHTSLSVRTDNFRKVRLTAHEWHNMPIDLRPMSYKWVFLSSTGDGTTNLSLEASCWVSDRSVSAMS